MTRFTPATIVASTLLLSTPAAAQAPAPLARADLLGTIGWLNLQASEGHPYDDWTSVVFLGAGGGWYWTDHLKTEIDGGRSGTSRRYAPRVVDAGGRPEYGASIYEVSSRRLAVSQQYQFFRNVWFHPHLGLGLDLTWEKTKRRDEPVYTYDPVTRQSRIVEQIRTFPTRTDLLSRPFAEVGFKAYTTRRSFFRGDVRVLFRDGVEDVLFRCGFGADF